MTDHIPNALAWRRPPKVDPFPAPEVEPPLVLRRKSDGPEERRMADKLEECTRRALSAWLRGHP